MHSIIRRSFCTKVVSSSSLLNKPISFTNSHGKEVTVDTVFEDTKPNGSDVGTVVAFHGVPGSHKDFKYIKPYMDEKHIRLISVNYPGFGITPAFPGIDFTNKERNAFFNSFLDSLKLDEQVVFLGHSRGTENALMLSLERRAKGLVMVNPTGLRPHRGISPRWSFYLMEKLYDIPVLRRLMSFVIKHLYIQVGLKPSSGEVAAHSVKSLNTMALGDQRKFIKPWKDSEIKLLFLYSGKDWIIEHEVLDEFVDELELPRIVVKEDDQEEQIQKNVMELMKNKAASVYYPVEGHYLQKTRAQLISNAIEMMFKRC